MSLFNRHTFCPRLWDEFYIDEKGDVYSCCHAKPKALGNLHEQTLEQICNGETIQALRRESLEGRLGCYEKCTLLDKNELKPVEMPLTIDYGDVKRLKVMFGEGCNIGCIMCPQNHKSKVALDADLLAQQVDLAPFESIELQGGEPIFIESARKFFDHAASQGKKVSFLTNGILVSEQWADRIALHSGFVYFSLNGATKATHEKVNKGSKWENVLKNVQRVRAARAKHGTDVRILGHMTTIPENYAEVPAFIAQYPEFGFDAIDFGYDWAMPKYLRSEVGLLQRRKLKQEVQAALKGVADPGQVITHRLKKLGLA